MNRGDDGGGEGGGGGRDDPYGIRYPDYEKESDQIMIFLRSFKDPYDPNDELKYMVLLQSIKDRQEDVLTVELDDLAQTSDELAERAQRNAPRYIALLERAADEILSTLTPQVEDLKEDVGDWLQKHREDQLRRAREADNFDDADADDRVDGADAGNGEVLKSLPPALTRRYQIRLQPALRRGGGGGGGKNGADKPMPLRDVRAEHIGQLVNVSGIVTRVSDVKPLVEVATHICYQCGFEIYQEVGMKQNFTPVSACPSEHCRSNNLTGKLMMQTRGSKFVSYQEVKLQELPDQVPVGNIPRSLTVTCRGANTRVASPGEMVTICGVFLPKRYTGFRGMKAGLISDTYLEASGLTKHKEAYHEVESSEEMQNKLLEASEDPDILGKLSRSIAPEIYGHEDVKRALLLQLIGGSARHLSDGMRIRGDINICLMGDPGVAKSQLLKHVTRISPRGVYTTGKGSSGVGLTAAVVKDEVTGDMNLEGGALVLADKGICCIDEFDKMDDHDRSAIHEVMEQQTVSIAKAGITTTLNARCAVLAAANPLYGRYNRRRTMAENINLPNSLLSRFDCLFLLLDNQDIDGDTALARHITYVHKHSKNPELGFKPYDPEFIKHYIAAAREFTPYVPRELASYIVEAYVDMRQKDKEDGDGMGGGDDENGDQAAMTARALLSILRLSQALARLHFSEVVRNQDVEEAIRITHMSKASLMDQVDGTGGGAGGGAAAGVSHDQTSKIFGVMRDAAVSANADSLSFTAVEAAVLRKGFSLESFYETLEEYQQLNVILVNQDRTRIDFVG